MPDSYLLASHPSPEDRIARIGERVARQRYPVRPTVPLAGDLPAAGAKQKPDHD